ncbi:MAG: DNA alkylation repair protein [Terracidiphilus sp.]|nr:DNA alkylation repair protein [Terracidiphilus sp.]
MAKAGKGGGADGFVAQVKNALRPLADARRAIEMKAYMRGQFDYLGIGTPERRAVLKPLHGVYRPESAEELCAGAEVLWALREREYQYAAVGLLDRNKELLELADLEWVLELVRTKSWWDTVDALAKVVGSVVRREGAKGQRRMDRALADEDFWVRRIALLHQLGWRAETDTERLFSYARKLGHEKEFFIRKAIGWALRDYAWHDWRAVERFLAEHGDELSGLSVREAGKNLAGLKASGGKCSRRKP